MDCKCTEGTAEILDPETREYKRVFITGHSCEYVKARNALIPLAEQEVLERFPDEGWIYRKNKKTGNLEKTGQRSIQQSELLSREFIKAMDRLYKIGPSRLANAA